MSLRGGRPLWRATDEAIALLGGLSSRPRAVPTQPPQSGPSDRSVTETPVTSGTRRFAVCDLGTFSALFLVTEVRKRRLEPILEERRTVDLAYSSPESRRIPPAAAARAVGAVRRFNRHAAHYGCQRAVVVCTAAIRHASNRRLVVAGLRQATPYPVIVLSPREEGLFTAAGARGGLRARDRFTLVVDIGGGSTEIVDPETGEIWRISSGAAWGSAQWRRGCPRLPERRADYYRRRASEPVFAVNVGWFAEVPQVIGVGGTITTLAAIRVGLQRFDPMRVHGMVLTRGWIARMADQFATMDRSALAALVPFDRDRARVLTVGTFLWDAVLNRLNVARVTVSVRGLRWGVASSLVSP